MTITLLFFGEITTPERRFWNSWLAARWATSALIFFVCVPKKANLGFLEFFVFSFVGVFVSNLLHYKDRSKFFLVCALNFSLHPHTLNFIQILVSERNWKN